MVLIPGRSLSARRTLLFVLSPFIILQSAQMSAMATASSNDSKVALEVDPAYPGTAVERMRAVRTRATSLTKDQLSDNWEAVRKHLLWAGGLRDLTHARPGQGYTGHSFNDFNHCDLTTMLGDVSDNENKGLVSGIAYGNRLGDGIRIASIEELGTGGSWSTCMMGCNIDPPRDVAHLQFKSRIAFKLVWCPGAQEDFTKFVLVDDEGVHLNEGKPTGTLPRLQERQQNYALVQGSKYAAACANVNAEL